MKRGAKSVFFCFGLLLLAVPTISSSDLQGRGSGGWGAGLPYAKLYKPATLRTLRGEVLWIKKLVPAEGMADGLHLFLKTRDEAISVHLGPLWFLERQDFSLAAGDVVEVVGSRVTYEGTPALIAAEVNKGDNVLRLREAGGFPLWSAWRRR